MKFGDVRKVALKFWLESSGRERTMRCDEFNDSLECDWQRRNDKHVSIFCSLATWRGCFSQQLTDERYDEFDLGDKEDSEVLYLYYNQVLLVIGEILNDLEKMYIQATLIKRIKKVREYLSADAFYSMDETQAFINNIVKHKAEMRGGDRFHACNHHLPIRFADNIGRTRCGKKTICIGNISSLSNMKSILMPSLINLIDLMWTAYSKMDEVFDNEENYQRLVKKYQKTVKC